VSSIFTSADKIEVPRIKPVLAPFWPPQVRRGLASNELPVP